MSALSIALCAFMVPLMRTLLFLVMVLCCCGQASAATVAMLNGEMVKGEKITFTDKGAVQIASKTVALADCDWIELGDGLDVQPSTQVAKKLLGVWLVDGSWMPVSHIGVGEKDHVIAVEGILGKMELPLTVIRGWGIGTELIGTESKEDQVQLESGLLTGRIDGIIGGKLILKSPLDPTKPLEIELDSIRGLRLAVPMKNPKGVHFTINVDDVHPPLRIMSNAKGLFLHAAPKIMIAAESLPMRMRIAGGRRVYLNELEPDIREETGAFGVVWPYQRGKNLDGSPLRLGGIRYENGIAVHSKARLGWKLDGAYERMRTFIGIADLVADQGDCAASILVDDKVVWSKDSIRGGEKPQEVNLDLTNAKRLELRVEYGARYDIADHLVLADAFLITVK